MRTSHHLSNTTLPLPHNANFSSLPLPTAATTTTSTLTTAPTQATRSWRAYSPRSNLIWLHFVLGRLLEHLSPFPSPTPSISPSPALSPLQTRADTLRTILDTVNTALDLRRLLPPRSTSGPHLSCNAAVHPRNALGKEISECGADMDAPGSAAELVAWAVAMGWLGVEDVVGEEGG